MKKSYEKIVKTVFYGLLIKSLMFSPFKANNYEQKFEEKLTDFTEKIVFNKSVLEKKLEDKIYTTKFYK
ncbi:MAG: hypothetical protein U9Q99_00485 [Nanoarchaeota archaeon]|nr:hypothetical protein [Nanoarchaeota archaeon]